VEPRRGDWSGGGDEREKRKKKKKKKRFSFSNELKLESDREMPGEIKVFKNQECPQKKTIIQ
jgi:hypothetical protein